MNELTKKKDPNKYKHTSRYLKINKITKDFCYNKNLVIILFYLFLCNDACHLESVILQTFICLVL